MKLNNEELVKIYGGAITMNSTLLNSIARIVTTLLDLGRSVGAAIARYRSKNYCM